MCLTLSSSGYWYAYVLGGGGGDRDLHNPSYDTKAKFTNCIIIHLK